MLNREEGPLVLGPLRTREEGLESLEPAWLTGRREARPGRCWRSERRLAVWLDEATVGQRPCALRLDKGESRHPARPSRMVPPTRV